ncbi:transketolase [Saccharothrix longispora]|uniref:Transketolase n=1 Tax=Saccharothrix longispora TaxID=33920 RepID=A0ABU1PVT6_9PSEU|nr:transketolase [Saccharothrix longispora]MDR6593999.1 transketolase [Saccharothrix longispora]
MSAPTELLSARALRIRERILTMGATGVGTHVGGSLSCVEVLAVLYDSVLDVRPDDPDFPDRDRFVLSKGHASAALYATLVEFGLLPESECDTYAVSGGRLAGHPLRRLPGVEFPTGSLGHGLSLGAGVALAAKRTGRPSRAFVLLGDGELQEGSVWEAAQFAPTVGLDNLVAVVDRNGWQITGRTTDLGLEPLADRWRSFGWAVAEVDGHDTAALREAFAAVPTRPGRPTVVLATTVKGKGVPLFEDKKKSHHVTLTPPLLARALGGLRARARRES